MLPTLRLQIAVVNRLVSQMRASLAACREPAGKLWQLCKVLYVFEHKTQYFLIHAPFIRIVVFWHIGNVPLMISYSQICCNTTTFCKSSNICNYNSWANLRCSSCSSLGENLCKMALYPWWNGSTYGRRHFKFAFHWIKICVFGFKGQIIFARIKLIMTLVYIMAWHRIGDSTSPGTMMIQSFDA